MLDQYYTPQNTAQECVEAILKYFPDARYIEPSEGYGAFSEPLREAGYDVLGYDIDPKLPSTVSIDFLKVQDSTDRIAVGNPPFGYRCNLAIKFFNHCANLGCPAVCFIVPTSFRKNVIQRRLNPYFHLVHDDDVREDFEGTTVRTCFQIWIRKDVKRIDTLERVTGMHEYKFVRTGNMLGIHPATDFVKHHRIIKLPFIANTSEFNQQLHQLVRNSTSITPTASHEDVSKLFRSLPMTMTITLDDKVYKEIITEASKDEPKFDTKAVTPGLIEQLEKVSKNIQAFVQQCKKEEAKQKYKELKEIIPNLEVADLENLMSVLVAKGLLPKVKGEKTTKPTKQKERVTVEVEGVQYEIPVSGNMNQKLKDLVASSGLERDAFIEKFKVA